MTRAEQGSRNDRKIRRRRAVVERYIPWQNPLPLRQGEARRGDESGTDEVSEVELRLVFWKEERNRLRVTGTPAVSIQLFNAALGLLLGRSRLRNCHPTTTFELIFVVQMCCYRLLSGVNIHPISQPGKSQFVWYHNVTWKQLDSTNRNHQFKIIDCHKANSYSSIKLSSTAGRDGAGC